MGDLWTNVGFKPFLDQIESANWPFVAVELRRPPVFWDFHYRADREVKKY